MKKLHKSILISISSLFILIILHYFIYLWNSNYDLWYLEWYVSTPIDLQNIEFQKEIRPTYFLPLRKLKYVYIEKNNANNIVIEINQQIFKWKMDIIKWKGIIEKYHKESWLTFLTWFASNKYPTPLFFLLQYIFIITFIIFSYKVYKYLRK